MADLNSHLPVASTSALEPPPERATFASLGVEPFLCKALQAMAIRKPTAVQAACIPAILKGTPSPCPDRSPRRSGGRAHQPSGPLINRRRLYRIRPNRFRKDHRIRAANFAGARERPVRFLRDRPDPDSVRSRVPPPCACDGTRFGTDPVLRLYTASSPSRSRSSSASSARQSTCIRPSSLEEWT